MEAPVITEIPRVHHPLSDICIKLVEVFYNNDGPNDGERAVSYSVEKLGQKLTTPRFVPTLELTMSSLEIRHMENLNAMPLQGSFPSNAQIAPPFGRCHSAAYRNGSGRSGVPAFIKKRRDARKLLVFQAAMPKSAYFSFFVLMLQILLSFGHVRNLTFLRR